MDRWTYIRSIQSFVISQQTDVKLLGYELCNIQKFSYFMTNISINGRTILEWILKKLVSIRGIGLIRLRIGAIGIPRECGIEPLGSISHGVSSLVIETGESPEKIQKPGFCQQYKSVCLHQDFTQARCSNPLILSTDFRILLLTAFSSLFVVSQPKL